MHLQLYTCTDILHLYCSKFIQKVVPSLDQATARYMCTILWSHTPATCTCTCKWLCVCKIWWSHSAGSHSPQRFFCKISYMNGISAIKTRWSLTTEIIKSSFYCNCMSLYEQPPSLIMIIQRDLTCFLALFWLQLYHQQWHIIGST